MATSLLLPGFGGRTSQTITTTADSVTHNSDVLDMSRIGQFGVQVQQWAAGNLVVQTQQSFDGTHWANLGTAFTLVVGDGLRFPVTAGPFGLIRYNVLSSDTAANAILTTVGYPLQWSS